jgi:thiamine pyrophosphate-dependent acetolactate synthase large subunit-like protein
MSDSPGISLRDALDAVRAARHDEDVVITTMAASREWMARGPIAPCDLVLVPSAMGQAPSFGLGIALTQPDRRVIVVNGDGSMLMNLGSLVTITALRPARLMLIVYDNGSYEVTGGQPSPGAPAGRVAKDRVDFATLARASGFSSVFHFSDAQSWQREIAAVMERPGPTFVWLDIVAVPDAGGPRSPGPAGERARRFREALAPAPR